MFNNRKERPKKINRIGTCGDEKSEYADEKEIKRGIKREIMTRRVKEFRQVIDE